MGLQSGNRIGICFDMDDTIYIYNDTYKQKRKKNPDLRYPQSEQWFFLNLPLREWAKETIQYFTQQEIFEIFFLSAPSLKNPHCFTEKFLAIQRDFWSNLAKNLCIYSNKSAFHPIDCSDPKDPKEYKKIYLVDDYKEGKGQEFFRGEVLHFGVWNDYPNWKTIKEYFDKKYLYKK